jgi:hypothetical protein
MPSSFPCPVRERYCAHHDATRRCRRPTSENIPSTPLVDKGKEKGRRRWAGPKREARRLSEGGPTKVSYLRGPPSLIGGTSYLPLVTSGGIPRFRFDDPQGIALCAVRIPKMGELLSGESFYAVIRRQRRWQPDSSSDSPAYTHPETSTM